jgi:hypothetical protein
MHEDLYEFASDLLPAHAAAKRIGLAASTLAKLRCWGGGPEFLKLGRKVVYRRAALEQWLADRVVNNTSDAARLPPRLAANPRRSAREARRES